MVLVMVLVRPELNAGKLAVEETNRLRVGSYVLVPPGRGQRLAEAGHAAGPAGIAPWLRAG
jgi:hypothetical protein